MKDKELWLNGSGYPDPTAYKAMKGMVNEVKDRIGEVWTINTHKERKTVLVVAQKDAAFALLELSNEECIGMDITIDVCGEKKHTNSILMSYCFNNRFVDKLSELSDEEFARVKDKIAYSFDIPMMEVTDFVRAAHDHTLEKDQIIRHLEGKNSEFFNLIQEQDKEIERLKAEILKKPSTMEIELTAERNLYKQLYEQTLERLIAR